MIHWFDIFVICFLSISAIWSFYRGFCKEVFSVLSLVVGYWFSSSYYVKSAAMFEAVMPERSVREMAAFAILFMLAVLVVIVLGIFLRKLLKVHSAISSADKFAGFGLGLIKGVLILCLIAFPLALIPGLNEDTCKNSLSAPVLMDVSGAILERFAPDMAKSLNELTRENVKDRGETIKKYKRTLDKLGETIKNNAGELTRKAGELKETVIDKKDELMGTDKPDHPTKQDRKELDDLIKKSDEGV